MWSAADLIGPATQLAGANITAPTINVTSNATAGGKCVPDISCPVFNQTAACKDAVTVNPTTMQPYLQPVSSLNADLAAQCPRVCQLISQCK